MTVIAWDGKTLAADKRLSANGVSLTGTKIYRVGKLLCGLVGSTAAALEMLAWIKGGRKVEDFPEAQREDPTPCVAVVIEKRAVLSYEGTPYGIAFEDPFTAFGSGREFAIAAMACGKTAAEAVEIACRFETACGNGIDTLEAK